MNATGCYTHRPPNTRCKHLTFHAARIGYVCNIPRKGVQAYLVNSLVNNLVKSWCQELNYLLQLSPLNNYDIIFVLFYHDLYQSGIRNINSFTDIAICSL